MNIWITSDLHLNHNRDFVYKERGFETIEEMNEALINNYNEVVKDEDEVYILGDCLMGRDLEGGIKMLKRLKGTKFLAIGNHDTAARLEAYEKADIFEDIQFAYRGIYKKKGYYLSHYPTLCANIPKDNIYNLCGHLHTKDRWINWDKGCYNCEVDAHNNYPVNLEDIIQEIKEKKL